MRALKSNEVAYNKQSMFTSKSALCLCMCLLGYVWWRAYCFVYRPKCLSETLFGVCLRLCVFAMVCVVHSWLSVVTSVYQRSESVYIFVCVSAGVCVVVDSWLCKIPNVYQRVCVSMSVCVCNLINLHHTMTVIRTNVVCFVVLQVSTWFIFYTFFTTACCGLRSHIVRISLVTWPSLGW